MNIEKMIRPVFTLELNHKIVPGLVIVGKYDGTHPCLTAATTADKVLIHSPHRKNIVVSGKIIWSETNREIATLNINQSISALITAAILPDDEKDILIIGTETHILAYHVHNNADVFYKECPDGVKALAVGTFTDNKTQIVMIGGNSSVHGVNHKGEEVFWTAVGDVVTALILMDYNNDNTNELIVSSEDFAIRVFKGNEIVSEYIETEVVTSLVALSDKRFAYSVSNGTVGIYEQDVRLWRVKSKHFAVAMQQYDLLGQGYVQLITTWSNGKIDCRSIKNGEVLFKDTLSYGAAGVVEGDYRSIGKTDLICISTEGEVRGYTTTKVLTNASGSSAEQETVRELLTRKQSLLMELKHYENNTKYNENLMNETESFENNGVIPANTRLQIGIATNVSNAKAPNVEVYLTTNNSTIIKAVIIFAEGIFKGESHVVHPPQSKLSSDISIPLRLPKDAPMDLHIKALVGYPNSVQFHVFEITRQLPRFSMYSLIESETRPESYVEFKINERLQRICMWINQNFLLSTEVEFETGPTLKLYLKCLRNDSILLMMFEISGKTVFYTDDMLLASNLVQSLSSFLKLESLQATAHFEKEENTLRHLMEKLGEVEDARLRLGTDVADRLGQIRLLVVRAEDSRLNNTKEVSKYYYDLLNVNQELINGYNIRLQNYNEGTESMKKINSIIQRSSKLRVGPNSANMINYCRTAIKNNNIDGLIKIIRTGEQ